MGEAVQFVTLNAAERGGQPFLASAGAILDAARFYHVRGNPVRKGLAGDADGWRHYERGGFCVVRERGAGIPRTRYILSGCVGSWLRYGGGGGSHERAIVRDVRENSAGDDERTKGRGGEVAGTTATREQRRLGGGQGVR